MKLPSNCFDVENVMQIMWFLVGMAVMAVVAGFGAYLDIKYGDMKQNTQ
jgi:hypothetical protein